MDRFVMRDDARPPEALFGVRLLVVTLLVALGSFTILAILQWNAGNLRLALAQAGAAVVDLALLLALKRARSTAMIAHGLCVLVTGQITLINVLYGGVEPPAMAFFSVSPLVALMTVGRRSAWAWLVVGIALIVSLNVAQQMGVAFPSPPPSNRWVDGAALSLLALVVLTFASSHANLSQRALDALSLANQELARARAHAEEANAAKDRLVATVSHELRTPLTGAIGFARLLDDAHLPPPHAENARAALTASETLLGLANDILDRARLSAGQLELQSAPFNLQRLLDDVVRVAAVTGTERGLSVSLDSTAAQFVVGDAARIKQVLLNLVGNAVKFTPQGSVTVRAHADGNRTRFAVVDTGVGIAADARERIFLPFVQAASPRRFGGAGLGLSIAKELVERMGGQLEVETREGEGSTFSFSLDLPLARKAEPTDTAISARPPLGMRVLAVDDDAMNRHLIKRLLQQMGVDCEVASSGQGALDALTRANFDAVLLDCEMPLIDGYEVARRVRERESAGAHGAVHHMPLLALTGSASPDDRARALASGMDDLIAKPFEPKQLYAWLRDARPIRAAVPNQADAAGAVTPTSTRD